MDIRQNRSWIYNRLMSNKREYNEAFLKEVDEFVSYACHVPPINYSPNTFCTHD